MSCAVCWALAILATLTTSSILAKDWTAGRFDREIAPLLAAHCLDCHSGAEPKGGLDLSSREAVLKGGESGAALIPGKIDESLIWKRVSAEEMPPKKPLPKEERATIRDWLAAGAVWGTSPIDPFRTTSSKRAGYDWWSLQPLQRPAVPEGVAGRNAIDAFVRAKLRDKGLEPSAQASPQVIIRRLNFDLLGLPPSPEEVKAFAAALEKNPDEAIRALVDKLLDSQHFGERWGRHWLDVVRFGESQGFERDKLRDNSWYYRDWVIDAMNNDMPYDQFVRQQIAGDVLHPDQPQAITATGFLVAGPWDEVGQSMRSDVMRAVVRQDEVEDYVGTIGQTFLGLTVNCARCHDHKFDPIRQKEYYQLAAAVGGLKHGSRDVNSRDNQQRLDEIRIEVRQLEDKIAVIDAAARNRLLAKHGEKSELRPRVMPVARWDFEKDLNDKIGNAHAVQHPKAKIDNGKLWLDSGTGYASTHPVDVALHEKTLEAWVRLDDLEQRAGAAISIQSKDMKVFDAIVYAETEHRRWIAGSDFFKRTQNLLAAAESLAQAEFVHMAITYDDDGKIAAYRNGEAYGDMYRSSGPVHFKAGDWTVLFGLRTGGPSPDRQLRGQLEAAQIYDRALTQDQVKASAACEAAGIEADEILAALTDDERARRDALQQAIGLLARERSKLQPHSVYAVAPTKPEAAHVLLRGNPATRGEPVVPGGVAAVPGVESVFGLGGDSSDADRRKKLAEWITSEDNPLFARVIVNRLWHYHFGAGIVTTPNDFGFNGGRPSHPELLDWLAVELIESGWRLKHIHRLIVTSATYLQESRHRAEAAAIDADNRWLWRKNPMRLEAEALRDSILSVAGQLNPQYGGPPYHDFTTFTSNTQFYTMTDPDGPEFYRRTVYRAWIRSGRNHLLDAFDCPDPSTTAPQRAVTTTPIQSLTLMNNSFVLRMSDRFAERVAKDAGDDPVVQTKRVYELAYGRWPSDDEIRLASTFITDYKLAAFCRVILNSNEFIHVD